MTTTEAPTRRHLTATRPLMGWRTVDILTIAFLGAALGIVFWGWGVVYNGPVTALKIGYAPLMGLFVGPWFLAGVVGGLVVRRPGAALFAEVVAALVSMIPGTEWGAAVLVSGILQAGYPVGYLCAALLYGLGFETLGWRGMFIVSIIPAAIVLYIRTAVPESPGWQAQRKASPTAASFLTVISRHKVLVVHATLLMIAAATFSHGTQDLYPTFLKLQHGLTVQQVATVSVIYNIGAVLGSLAGGALSQILGRRRLISLAAGAAMLLMPVWGLSSTLVAFAATAFVMQFLVQCTFGVLPAHLNELAPASIRGTLSGLVYQLGNMMTAGNTTIQAALAAHWGGNYGAALAVTAAGGALVLCILALVGPEDRKSDLRSGADPVA